MASFKELLHPDDIDFTSILIVVLEKIIAELIYYVYAQD